MNLLDVIKTIKERRVALKVTQESLAELSGVGLRTLKQFESGEVNPILSKNRGADTPFGNYRLSPAYDLLNSRIHIEDKDFALDDGLLPRNLAQGKIGFQFAKLDEEAAISQKTYQEIMALMIAKTVMVVKMVAASFLNDSTKSNYFQSYQGRLKQLIKI